MNPFERTVLAMRKAQIREQLIYNGKWSGGCRDMATTVTQKLALEKDVDLYLKKIQEHPLDHDNPNQLRIDEV